MCRPLLRCRFAAPPGLLSPFFRLCQIHRCLGEEARWSCSQNSFSRVPPQSCCAHSSTLRPFRSDPHRSSDRPRSNTMCCPLSRCRFAAPPGHVSPFFRLCQIHRCLGEEARWSCSQNSFSRVPPQSCCAHSSKLRPFRSDPHRSSHRPRSSTMCRPLLRCRFSAHWAASPPASHLRQSGTFRQAANHWCGTHNSPDLESAYSRC